MKYGVEMAMLRERMNKYFYDGPVRLELDELENLWADFSYEKYNTHFVNVLGIDEREICAFMVWLEDNDINF